MKRTLESTSSERLSKYAEGRRDFELPLTPQKGHFVKMIVLDVVSDPNTSSQDEVKKTLWQAMGVTNIGLCDALPRNTIIAQEAGEQRSPMFVFPFFPSHLSIPCKAGECVWVMIEKPWADSRDIAYWFCRVVEMHTSDDVNHAHPVRANVVGADGTIATSRSSEGQKTKYDLRNGLPVKLGDDTGTDWATAALPTQPEDVFERLITETDSGKSAVYEPVPRYKKNPSDVVFEGSNNTLIVMGADRDDADPNQGVLDLVVGRGITDETHGKEAETTGVLAATKDRALKKELDKTIKNLSKKEGEVDYKNDRSRVFISQRSKTDKKFSLDSNNKNFKNPGIEDSEPGDPCIVLKSDKIRLIARQDLQIIVTGNESQKASDGTQIKSELTDGSKWASITLKTNGDIVFTPASKGVIKLGGDDADLAVLCEKATTGASDGTGNVTCPAGITDTMGGVQGTGASGQGTFAKKVLLK